ncbi:MAG TPA: recombinase family protein [Candidatus Cybelea sp.]|jgi:DNA invertase Pin-like site-specific DNA recombinase
MKRVVSYIRVSTARQGASGLGIEAQRVDVAAFCERNGYKHLEEFLEIESGRRSDRPILRQALERAEAARAVLVIARLDRLSRNVAFIANLLESEVEFKACDIPSANRLTLHVLAAVAEEEARAISTRTKAALAAAKARGVLLGAANPKIRIALLAANSLPKARLAARVARRHLRDKARAQVAGTIAALRMQGYGYGSIAYELNDREFKTSRGNRWRASTVWRAAKGLQSGTITA